MRTLNVIYCLPMEFFFWSASLESRRRRSNISWTSIHLFSIPTLSCAQGRGVLLEPSPAQLFQGKARVQPGQDLYDKLTEVNKPHWRTHKDKQPFILTANWDFPLCLTFLTVRKPWYLARGPGIKPKTFLLWADSANNHVYFMNVPHAFIFT